MPASPTSTTEARTERSRRTRSALLDAVVALLEEGDAQPSAKAIAARAGVSTRSVFTHFESLEALNAAVVERATAATIRLLHPIDPHQPLDRRVVEVCEQRALVHREIGPLRRAASGRLGSSASIDAARAFSRRSSIAQIHRIFATELEPLDAPLDRHLVATIDALLAPESWDLLTEHHDLAGDDAVDAMAGTLLTLLRGIAGPTRSSPEPPTGEATGTGPGGEVGRLLDAIEAGAPAELVVPRLRRRWPPSPPTDAPAEATRASDDGADRST